MTARRALLAVTAVCVAATAFGLVVGQGGKAALASALLLASALVAAAAWQLRPARRHRPRPRAQDNPMPSRLRQIAEDLRESEQSGFGVDRAFRPLLAPIVAARLGRRGVDMTLAPDRAQELLGDALWEIVRPDRPVGSYSGGPGLAGDDLRRAIERLEQL